ncbi:MAG: diacylglycerol kinase family lipid kinase [Chloroflexi bacterium]|nr:diacylglycerol kinase family lipid kinase [Chloroflexota bacterium]
MWRVILNPYSNRWRARERWPQAEQALRQAGLTFEVVVSEYKRHILTLAEQAVADGVEGIIVAGGDGSIGEAVNGIVRALGSVEALPPIGILPLGSANDFASNIGLPLDLFEAAQVIARGQVARFDLCQCNERYFVNNSAIGLEPYVTIKHERIQWIKGQMRYVVAALWAIAEGPNWKARLEWDGGTFEGPVTLLSVGNGPRTGGVFYMTPHADPRDGRLTFVFAYRPSRLAMLQTMPATMKSGAGNYTELPGVHEYHASYIKISLNRPSPAHTDGELFEHWLQTLEYRIHPGRLSVYCAS